MERAPHGSPPKSLHGSGQQDSPPAGATGHRPLHTLEGQLVAVPRRQIGLRRPLRNGAPRVYGLVLRILRDAHQSEEVTQEVLLQLWELSNRFDPHRGSAHAWVMTMAHRRAVDRVRSTEAWRRRDIVDAQRTLKTSFDQTSEEALTCLEAEAVRTALASLSAIQRQAVELAYFGGHTHREVSRLLQLPLGTAKTRIRDGLSRLRDVLSPDDISLRPS